MPIPVREGDLAELAPDWEIAVPGVVVNPVLRNVLLALSWPAKVLEVKEGLVRLEGLRWGGSTDTVDIRRVQRSSAPPRDPVGPTEQKGG